jgi:hypothetical protein
MKNEILKKLIKEEIKKILELDDKNSTEREKISGGEFNKELLAFNAKLRGSKAGLGPTELVNLLDLFDLIVEYARQYNLTQNIENRFRIIIDPRNKIQNTIDTEI